MVVKAFSSCVIDASNVHHNLAVLQKILIPRPDDFVIFELRQALEHETGQCIVTMEDSAMCSNLHNVQFALFHRETTENTLHSRERRVHVANFGDVNKSRHNNKKYRVGQIRFIAKVLKICCCFYIATGSQVVVCVLGLQIPKVHNVRFQSLFADFSHNRLSVRIILDSHSQEVIVRDS